MVWLSHQNIRHTQVGLDQGRVAQWLAHLVYIWGIWGGLGSNPVWSLFLHTATCPGYITRDTEFAGFTPNLFFFKMAQDRKRCNHADITTRLHIDFQNPTSCRVCRARKHKAISPVFKAISLDFKVISSYKKKKNPEITFEIASGKRRFRLL
jgi:hypothetical protein